MSSHWLNKAQTLHKQLVNHGYHMVVAVECEFYLSPDLAEADLQSVIEHYNQAAAAPLVEENGQGQFEYHLLPSASINDLIAADAKTRTLLAELSRDKVLFSSKPFNDQPSSGLHIHVHAEDASGKRLYYKKDAQMSDELQYSLAGLLANLEEAAAILLHDGSAERFASNEDHLPTTVSWGNNNRTCAIRLPDTEPDQKRIEYRIAGSDASLPKLLAIIFASLLDGIQRKPTLPDAIFGNASDVQYKLTRLPVNLKEGDEILSREFSLRHRLA